MQGEDNPTRHSMPSKGGCCWAGLHMCSGGVSCTHVLTRALALPSGGLLPLHVFYPLRAHPGLFAAIKAPPPSVHTIPPRIRHCLLPGTPPKGPMGLA